MTPRGQHVIVAPLDEPVDSWIREVRERYDPIAGAIPAHVTLVYPFEAEIDPAVLREHIATAMRGAGEVHVVLDGVSGAENQYLRYDIKRGNDELIALHDRLYTGLLARYLDITESFQPHVTIGRIGDSVQCSASCSTSSAREEFVDFSDAIATRTRGPARRWPELDLCAGHCRVHVSRRRR